MNSVMNIETLLLKDEGFGKLGFYSNASVYIGVCVGSIYAERLIKKVGGLKNALIIGAFLCVPYLASFNLPALQFEGKFLEFSANVI